MEIYLDEFEKGNNYGLSEDLVYIEDIDKGSFGQVIHAKEKATNKDISVKIINKGQADQRTIKKMKEEILILKKLNHNNIVKFYGHMETLNQLLIKMEYLGFGTLSQWMKNNKHVSEEDASLILKNILSAINYLHSNQICHRDIKPENIMFSRENNLNSIKLIDFGLSLQNFDSLYSSDYCGTFVYMAPEQIEKKSYYLSVDIWSIGILMYMLLNKGEHPFYHKGDTRKDFINNLKNIKQLKFNNKMSYMAVNLLKKLLEPDPLKRYKANDALKHPWITRNIEDKIPQTVNEQININNIKNNMRDIMMTSIFLNYLKKKNFDINGNEENLCNTNNKKKKLKNFLSKIENTKIKKKIGIYKISKEYLKKCEYISKIEKIKLKELKEKCLDVSNYDDNSNTKANTNDDSKNNTHSNANSHTNSNINNNNSNIINNRSINNNTNSNINSNNSNIITNRSINNTNSDIISNNNNSNIITNRITNNNTSNNNNNINNNNINNTSINNNKNLLTNNSNKNILSYINRGVQSTPIKRYGTFKNIKTNKFKLLSNIKREKKKKIMVDNMTDQKYKNINNIHSLSNQKINNSSTKLNSNNSLFITQLDNELKTNNNTNNKIVVTYKSKPAITPIKFFRNNSICKINNIMKNVNGIIPIKLFLNDYSEVKPKIWNYHEKFNIPSERKVCQKNTIIPKNSSNLFKLPRINDNITNRKKNQCNNSFKFII